MTILEWYNKEARPAVSPLPEGKSGQDGNGRSSPGNKRETAMKYQILSSQKELIRFVDGHRRIFIYGVNPTAAGVIHYLTQEGIRVCGVVVIGEPPEARGFEGVPIRLLSSIHWNAYDGLILSVEKQEAEAISGELEKKVQPDQVAFNGFMWSSFIVRPEGDAPRSRESGYFSPYKELQAIGAETGTDKAGDYHNYCNKYEFFLQQFRDRDFVLLELGVFHGASLRMWRQYFSRARIIGVDVMETCRQYVAEDGRTALLIRDISSADTLHALRAYHPSVIVDDASHIWSQQIQALFGLFDALTPGGVYILEDIHTSFLPLNTRYHAYSDQMVSAYRILSAIAEEVTGNDQIRIYQKRELLPYIEGIEQIAAQTELVSFMHDSCILIKK